MNGEGAIPTPENPVPGYSNWLPPWEPSNSGTAGEQYLAIGISGNFGWNDEGFLGGLYGYVVEYDTSVPEPGTLALVGLGLCALGSRRRRGAKLTPPRSRIPFGSLPA